MLRRFFASLFVLVPAGLLLCLQTASAATIPATTFIPLTPTSTAAATVTLPKVPSLTAKVVSSTIELQWGKRASTLVEYGYTVFRSEQKGVLGSDVGHPASTARSFTDTKVTRGHTYYYTVRYYRRGARVTNGAQVKITFAKVTPKPITTTKVAATVKTSTTKPVAPKTTPAPSGAAANTPPISTPNLTTEPTTAPTVSTGGGVSSATGANATATANDTTRISVLDKLQTALALYFNDQSSYPTGTGVVLGIEPNTCLNSDGWESASDCPYPYMDTVPMDPGASNYTYTASADGSTYTISDKLDGTINGLSGTIKMTPGGITQ